MRLYNDYKNKMVELARRINSKNIVKIQSGCIDKITIDNK